MTARITVVITGTAATIINSGNVVDPSGNVWNLPASFTITAGGTGNCVCTAKDENATWPGSNVALTIGTPVAGWTAAATAGQVTPPVFQSCFPEFADTQRFPLSLIQFQLNWAYQVLNAGLFGTDIDLAAMLFSAHYLTQERRAMDEANSGKAPGMATGAAASRGVDKASVSYDTGSVAEDGAGDWNQTIYGRRMWKMIQMYGMGPMTIGIGCSPVFTLGTAWSGPPPWPGWFG